MSQKVLQIGTSAGITISKDLLQSLGLKIGDQVTIEINAKHSELVVLPLRRKKSQAELSAWTDKFIAQYGPALKALAKK
jgi:putative addiction module antidote